MFKYIPMVDPQNIRPTDQHLQTPLGSNSNTKLMLKTDQNQNETKLPNMDNKRQNKTS